MGALCTVADVEALVGAPIPAEALDRVERLITLASGVVTDACRPLPVAVPDTVTTVTATLVARQYLNPSMATSEGLAGYRVGYRQTGMGLTDSERDALGSWGAPAPGSGAYTTLTPSPFALDYDNADGVVW
jgi:hypothetical protein